MNEFKDKSNNEILSIMKQLEIDHENIKQNMILLYDKMISTEKRYKSANEEINKRMKGGN